MLTNDDIKKYDTSNMFDAIKYTYKQIEDSLSIINNFNPKISSYDSVIICGMGGLLLAVILYQIYY